MQNIDEIFVKYQSYRKRIPHLKETTLRLEVDFLKMFIRFLKEKVFDYSSINPELMISYEHWLLNSKDRTGCYFSVKWFWTHYHFLKMFFNWLEAEKIISANPLLSEKRINFRRRITRIIEARRDSNLKLKPSGLRDEALFSLYLENVAGFRNLKGIRRIELALDCLKEFLPTVAKTVLSLSEEDFPALREFAFTIDSRPHVTGIIASFMNFVGPIRTFYRWIHQEGYTSKNPIVNFKIYELEAYINKRRAEERLKKKNLFQEGKNLNLDEILKQYREDRLKITLIKKQSHKAHFIHLEYFIRFFRQSGVNLPDINSGLVEQFKQWLFDLKGEEGFYYSAGSITYCLQCLGAFISWLVENFYLNENPLSGFNLSQYKFSLVEKLEARRKTLLKLRFGRHDDAGLVKVFMENYLLKQYPDSERRFICSFKVFSSYLLKNNRTILSLGYTDIKSLLDFYLEKERYSSLTGSLSIVRHYFAPVNVLYRWLYEEGYLENNPLDIEEIHKFIEKHFYRRAGNSGGASIFSTRFIKPFKGRYYTVKEILKTYKKHLEKVYKGFAQTKGHYFNLKFFLRFLITRQKTVYSCDHDTLEEYKKHLFNHEYEPGRYYSALSQREKMQMLKRFYDWLLFNGIAKDHPLKDFNLTEFYKKIKALRKTEKRINPDEQVPKNFREIYAGAYKYEKSLNLTEGTVKQHKSGWRFLFVYLEKLGIKNFRELDEKIIAEYHVYLSEYKNDFKQSMSINTRVKYLAALKRLLQYLARFKYMKHDLSGAIVFPKHGYGLPTAGIGDKEALKLVEIPDINDKLFLRTRAILEFLYSTGARSNELCTVKVKDLDIPEGMVRINIPKGGVRFQRRIPIGKTACFWVQKYIDEYRSKIAKPENEYLFINIKGEKIDKQSVANTVKSAVMKSGLGHKKIVTHSFRVACATGMLKGKANIKHVQEQLGHVSIQSTSKYLRLVPDDLKKAHSKSHPRDRKQEE